MSDSQKNLNHPSADNPGDLSSDPPVRSEGILFTEDDVFIKRVFETDPKKGFELLFKKYYSTLCNHAVRFVYSKQKAEDIVVDVFLLFWNNKLYANVKGSFRTYLFTAVRNKCWSYLKWEFKKERSEELGDIDVQSFYATPEQILYATDLHIKIEQTIRALPPRQQEVFVMSRFEGKRNKQIAATMQLSLKTVEMHLSKSLAKLRAIFQQ